MVLAPADSDHLVDEVIRRRLLQLESQSLSLRDAPFFVADLGQVFQQHRRWKSCFPAVEPFYAVKCNPDPVLLTYLANLGTGFDCASVNELEAVLQLGVDPSRIIFANPCKASSAIAYARQNGVMQTTFDNLDELDNIKEYNPDAELFLRIFAEDKTALVNLGDKYGAPLESVDALLHRARELRLAVVGVSFHVGTGASDVKSFITAIQHAAFVIRQAERLGFCIRFLDVGGGFQDSNFETTASTVQATINQEIPKYIQILGEPGRFYARSFYTMTCKVLSRRKQTGSMRQAQSDMLYQNDGVYGCFMNALLEKEIFVPSVIQQIRASGAGIPSKRTPGEHRYSIWGPTCDSIDCVTKGATLNTEVMPGDWLKYQNMGAYTTSTSTNFNGFSNRYDVIYIDSGCLSISEAGQGGDYDVAVNERGLEMCAQQTYIASF